ncbi:hypothetical protein [Aridibaculum aurantiacum]|uniref:hypothetical protein n=1 Tax=Aridibaculum aurantiacum TaxID=2810307 RepID=UPI001A962332|nr:hypothetical protein [Aridibaculum aurantiacum]
MKKQFMVLAFAASLSFVACNESTTETSTEDSTANNTTNTGATTSGTDQNQSGRSINSSFDESGSYMDLRTNKPVRITRNTQSQTLMNSETNEPLSYFFYNPSTRDTFDMYGYRVNNYLIRGNDNTYTLDEERWRTKMDSDGDMKMKDGDETKVKYDASSGRTKIKTEDTVIKRQ